METAKKSDSTLPYFLTSAFVNQSVNVIRFTWRHPANKGERARALLRLVRFQARGRLLSRPTVARLGDRSSILAYLHRSAAAKVVYANPPDHPEMLVWRQYLRRGDLFVDVGANVGSYSIWAAELGAEVIAFEPAQDTFALLSENVALNGYDVTTIPSAVGSHCGTVRFTEGKDTVNRINARGAIETPLVTIDSVIKDRIVAGMKIDVEGFEIDVLRGCAHALTEHRIKLIQLEWNATSEAAVGTDRRPVADLLSKYGYRLYRPDLKGELLPVTDLSYGSDVFCLPEE
jgi:FkbM family methyltransferase